MTIPQLSLFAFALWTLLVPLGAIGVYRWSLILRGARPIHTFRADAVDGADWYRRAMRAHMNCVENLPVFAVLVWSVHSLGLASALVDALCLTLLAARAGQTSVHIARPETSRSVSWRFALFFTQLLCMFALAGLVLARLGAG